MKKILIITSVVIAILVGARFVTVKIGEANRAKMLAASSTPSVQLDEVKQMEVYKSIEIPGRVQSADKVDLVARIDGYLQKKHFKEGDFVKKGQILLTIEPTQYLNNLNKAKADLENAKAVSFKANRDYDRGAELVKKDYISKSTYDGLYADKLAASAKVAAASAALAEAQRNYGYTSIESPVDGKIGSLNIQEGNYVTMQSGTLATVIKTNPIYVKYSVDSKQFDQLRKLNFIPKKGAQLAKVDVVLPSGQTYPVKGVQDFFDNQISTSTGTIDFRATFKNDDHVLIPGDFVKVKVYSNVKQDVLTVPQEYTLQDSKGRFVYVVDENNLVQTRYFKDNGQYENYWIIKDGLKEGDKFVTTGLTKLMPKQKVKIVETQAPQDQKAQNEAQEGDNK
ncbi:MAG: efflux RND transporter periplasmic adaptor subunit [Candidatus Gastranaerophilales bacterium]|nr:efflux RND transporter periplasmic adaptor subunit [Candidatus Gastranaerophilales bacterium]